MLKWGDKEEIEKQRKALSDLDAKRHTVPLVLSHGEAPGPTPTDREVGWYRMPRYVMPSLGELLIRAEGFNPYELATLARATFQHLRRFFWRDLTFESVTEAEGGTASAVGAALTAAHGAMENTGIVLKGYVELAIQRRPIVAFGKLRVLPPTEMARIVSLWPKLLKGEAQLSLLVEGSPVELKRIYGANGLGALATKIVTIVTNHTEDAWVPVVTGGRIHGDAHFENFLVDASIPEDPFAVAIDLPSVEDIGTGWVFKKSSMAGDLMREWGIALPTGRVDVLSRTQRDPSYDIAKLLLSATCWFGAVQRGAFVIEDQGSSAWKLTAGSAREPQASGNETRGVSEAKVLRFVAPIGPEVWGNHAKAASVILQEYVELLTLAAKDSPWIDINCAINVSLLRTFFFLIRNAFSIAPRLFLSRPTNAAVMFAIAEHCAFEVDRLLSSEESLESDSLTTKLRARLTDITAEV